jgi:16S rRNA (uracil1498-N3)-methyltransferase
LDEAQANYLAVMRLAVRGRVRVLTMPMVDGARRWQRLVNAKEPVAVRDKPPAADATIFGCCLPIQRRAPILSLKKSHRDGAARILPVQTRFTNADRIPARQATEAHAIEQLENNAAVPTFQR